MQQVSSKDNFLVSYDVCTLFTSIPLQETIQIAVELIFQNNPQLKVTKHELNNFLILLHQVPILFSIVASMVKLMGYQWDLP